MVAFFYALAPYACAGPSPLAHSRTTGPLTHDPLAWPSWNAPRDAPGNTVIENEIVPQRPPSTFAVLRPVTGVPSRPSSLFLGGTTPRAGAR